MCGCCRLLRLLSHAPTTLLLAGRQALCSSWPYVRAFPALPLQQQQQMLLDWQCSALPPLRKVGSCVLFAHPHMSMDVRSCMQAGGEGGSPSQQYCSCTGAATPPASPCAGTVLLLWHMHGMLARVPTCLRRDV